MSSTLTLPLRAALRAPARRASPLLLRHSLTTAPSPSSASSAGTPRPPPGPSSLSSGGKPSATALFYRQLVPSMIACLAIGSCVYYALELTHSILDREVVVRELEGKVASLEAEVEHLRAETPPVLRSSRLEDSGKSWWKVW